MAHQVLNYRYGSNHVVEILGGLAITIGIGTEANFPLSLPLPSPPTPSYDRYYQCSCLDEQLAETC